MILIDLAPFYTVLIHGIIQSSAGSQLMFCAHRVLLRATFEIAITMRLANCLWDEGSNPLISQFFVEIAVN
jgi:hypothetical protein